MTIGGLIKTTRKRAGMTQKQLAERLGVSYVNISQLENDQRTPKCETVLSIAAALGVEWEELVPVNMQGNMIAAHVIEKAGLKLVSRKDKKVKQTPTPRERINAALDQMTPEGQERVAGYAEDILPRYQASAAPESTPASQEGEDTAPPTGTPETPPEGE